MEARVEAGELLGVVWLAFDERLLRLEEGTVVPRIERLLGRIEMGFYLRNRQVRVVGIYCWVGCLEDFLRFLPHQDHLLRRIVLRRRHN